MSDELEIARIGAALTIVNNKDSDSSHPLDKAATEFLIRQFTPPEPKQLTSQEFVKRNIVPVMRRCPNVRPGRTLKHEDALHCAREVGHAGLCDFNNDPKQHAEPRT